MLCRSTGVWPFPEARFFKTSLRNVECRIQNAEFSGDEMKQNSIEDKSFDFAVRIVNLYKYLKAVKNEGVLSKQLLRSGTGIGANVSEAQRAQSKADFVAKMNIALKEANETHYWIKLLYKTDYLTENEFNSLNTDIDEIVRLLVSICKTSANS